MNLSGLRNFLPMLKELILKYGIKIIGAVIILLVGRIIVNILVKIARKAMEKGNVEETLTGFIANIIHFALAAVVWLAVLGNLGVQTTSLVAVFGAAGLAVGLALQGSLSNFGAGVLIILFRPFKKDDYIEAAGSSGSVKEITVFNTTLLTPDNKLVILPNSSVIGSSITNYSSTGTRRVDFVFGIGYGDDLLKAKGVLEKILSEETRGLKDKAPMVAVKALGESSVDLTARIWVNTADYWDVYFAITEKVKLTFDKENISIPYPQTDVHLYKS
jgi:small conductance mechanosensitive channel